MEHLASTPSNYISQHLKPIKRSVREIDRDMEPSFGQNSLWVKAAVRALAASRRQGGIPVMGGVEKRRGPRLARSVNGCAVLRFAPALRVTDHARRGFGLTVRFGEESGLFGPHPSPKRR